MSQNAPVHKSNRARSCKSFFLLAAVAASVRRVSRASSPGALRKVAGHGTGGRETAVRRGDAADSPVSVGPLHHGERRLQQEGERLFAHCLGVDELRDDFYPVRAVRKPLRHGAGDTLRLVHAQPVCGEPHVLPAVLRMRKVESDLLRAAADAYVRATDVKKAAARERVALPRLQVADFRYDGPVGVALPYDGAERREQFLYVCRRAAA